MKMIAMFKRHPSLTPEQFREEYEKVHVPLGLKFLPYLKDYRRNYIRSDVIHHRAEGDVANGLDFDVITELTFESRADYDRMVAQMSDPAFQAEIVEHEKQFMDYGKTLVLFVDEVQTPLPAAQR